MKYPLSKKNKLHIQLDLYRVFSPVPIFADGTHGFVNLQIHHRKLVLSFHLDPGLTKYTCSILNLYYCTIDPPSPLHNVARAHHTHTVTSCYTTFIYPHQYSTLMTGCVAGLGRDVQTQLSKTCHAAWLTNVLLALLHVSANHGPPCSYSITLRYWPRLATVALDIATGTIIVLPLPRCTGGAYSFSSSPRTYSLPLSANSLPQQGQGHRYGVIGRVQNTTWWWKRTQQSLLQQSGCGTVPAMQVQGVRCVICMYQNEDETLEQVYGPKHTICKYQDMNKNSGQI